MAIDRYWSRTVVIDTHVSFDEDDVFYLAYTVKKGLAVFPALAGMTFSKLSLAGNNLPSLSPRKVWSKQIQESRYFFSV